jgi:hypothetical protein
MAILPTEIIADYALETVDTTQGIFIPLTSLPGLTAAQANATTGDGREVVKALVFALFDGLEALPTPPTRILTTETTAVTGENSRRTSLTFELDLSISRSDFSLQPEPA